MLASNTEYDYEEVIKQLNKKDFFNQNLEDEKNNLNLQHWAALRSYYEAKDRFEVDNNAKNVVTIVRSDKLKMRNNSEQEHIILDQKLEYLELLHSQIREKNNNQGKMFFSKLEKIYHEFQELPNEFNNKTVHQTAQNLKKSLKLNELEIANGNKEMENLKMFIENFAPIDELSNVKAVTEIIQKESLNKYGDPTKLQHRLSEVRKNIEALKKKIQCAKVKYGI